MDRILEKALLYDFYGELLTKHQRQVYESVVYDDMSLSEIADEQGITRQGVHDLVRRCDLILAGYEDKLKLVKRFLDAKGKIKRIEDIADLNGDVPEELRLKEIKELACELLKDW